jgi:hypothetical protein
MSRRKCDCCEAWVTDRLYQIWDELDFDRIILVCFDCWEAR